MVSFLLVVYDSLSPKNLVQDCNAFPHAYETRAGTHDAVYMRRVAYICDMIIDLYYTAAINRGNVGCKIGLPNRLHIFQHKADIRKKSNLID